MTDPAEDLRDLTSFHVRRAEAGDPVSLDWVVRRFSPLLLAQAEFRLGPGLRALRDPEDLVSEVWAVVLPKLAELGSREGRKAPVLLRFLTTTLLNRTNDMVKTEIAGPRGRRIPGGMLPTDADHPLAKLADDSRGVVTSVIRRERDAEIGRALRELGPEDHQIIMFRGIEQIPGSQVAFILEISENAVSMRYRRALERLRVRLPGSVFDELPAE